MASWARGVRDDASAEEVSAEARSSAEPASPTSDSAKPSSPEDPAAAPASHTRTKRRRWAPAPSGAAGSGDQGAPQLVPENSEMRRAIWKFLIGSLATLLIVVVPVVIGASAISRQQAIDHAIERTQSTADFAVAPFIDERLLAGEPNALDRMDRLLQPRFERHRILRIKVWSSDGVIIYSDERSLVGQQFDLQPWQQELLAGDHPGIAHFEPQTGFENTFESGQGEMLEVYVATGTTGSEPVLYETYYQPDEVRADEREMMLGILPPVLGALAVLQLVQLVPALRMARRLQRDSATRRQLLQRAIESSELERQRLARDLHDDVIQDLSGVAYALESFELQDQPPSKEFLARTRALVQDNISALRGITTELYPPDLADLGLAGALERLGDPVRARGLEWHLRVVGDPAPDAQQAALLYRAAREAITNAIKHARASVISVELSRSGDRIQLAVYDDGEGFERSSGAPEGHLGLQILQDTVSAAGGRLDLHTAPRQGTEVLVSLPA